MENDQKMRDIASQVFDEKLKATQYGFQSQPFHLHNGTDSPRIPESSLTAGFTANCALVMATDGATYTIGLNFQGKRLDFDGIALHKTAGTIDKRAIVIGMARLGNSYELQGLSATSVVVGGPIEALRQGSSALCTDQAATPMFAASRSQNFIAFVQQPGTGATVAQAEVISFSSSNVKIKVTLATGWELNGNMFIS